MWVESREGVHAGPQRILLEKCHRSQWGSFGFHPKGVSFTWKSSSWPLQGGQWVKGPVQSLGGDGAHGQGRGLLKKSCRKDLLKGRLDWTWLPRKLTASLGSWILKPLGLPFLVPPSPHIPTFPGCCRLIPEQLLSVMSVIHSTPQLLVSRWSVVEIPFESYLKKNRSDVCSL